MKQKLALAADSDWKDIQSSEFRGSPFVRIGRDWMLITAGDIKNDKGNWNTMTASWGGLGVLWGMDVAFIFVRPVRHTFGFLNDASLFSLSFFDESFRPALDMCGKKSGADTDKASEAGLSPIFFSGNKIDGAVGFKEASEIIFCRKIFTQDFDPAGFTDASIEKHYPKKDYHRVYIGEITGIKIR